MEFKEREMLSPGYQEVGPQPVEGECPMKITLATTDEGCRITITNQLLTELVRNPRVKVCAFVPSINRELMDWAKKLNVELVEPRTVAGYFGKELLAYPPDSLDIDILIIHSYGLDLGRQAQLIKEKKRCKWVHVVHTNSEELKKYLENEQETSSQSEQQASEHDVQLALCEQADIVIAIGPKIAEAYRSALRSSRVEVFDLTPEIIPDLIDVRQGCEDGEIFRVFICATYHAKYFRVKGCDIAAKAISLLQDTSYHIIFLVLHTENADKLKTRLSEEFKLNQFTVRQFSRDPDHWRKLLCEVDLAIMPSRAEGFGTSQLRAMSADLPVLVSGNSGLGMALKKLPSGRKNVVYSEDPQVWANRIKEVRAKGAGNRASEAKKLRREYMEKFNWREQCGILVERMFGMVPNKKGGTKSTDQNLDPDKSVECIQKQIECLGSMDKGSASGTGVKESCDVVDAPRITPGQLLTSPRLYTKVTEIPRKVYSEICIKLSIERTLESNDFRMLAEKVGLSSDHTEFLRQKYPNPADEILKAWSTKKEATVGRLIEMLKKEDFNRSDVAQILERWVLERE